MAKLAQRYSHATQSSNLKDDSHHHQTEVLAAVALSSELGSLLFRVKYANDATGYSALLTAWHAVVKNKAALRGWPESISASQIARLSLDYWLADVCPDCSGKGYATIKDVPSVLSDVACKSCNGTAKRPIQVRDNALIKFVEEMVETLEEMTRRAGTSAIKKLAKDMDFL